MKKAEATDLTPAPARGGEKSSKNQTDPRKFFIGAVLDMSWQLAAVVLIPVIVGVELDKHYDKTPLFTIIGFALAAMGVVVVIKRVLKEYSPSDPKVGRK